MYLSVSLFLTKKLIVCTQGKRSNKRSNNLQTENAKPSTDVSLSKKEVQKYLSHPIILKTKGCDWLEFVSWLFCLLL